jgi:hypothetical protein
LGGLSAVDDVGDFIPDYVTRVITFIFKRASGFACVTARSRPVPRYQKARVHLDGIP